MKPSFRSASLSRFFSLLFAALLFTTPALLTGCDTVDPGLETEENGSALVLAKETSKTESFDDEYEEDAPTFVVTEMADDRPSEGETTEVEGYVSSDASADEQTPEPGDIYYLDTGDNDRYSYNAEVINVIDAKSNGSEAMYDLRVEITEVFYQVPDFEPPTN